MIPINPFDGYFWAGVLVLIISGLVGISISSAITHIKWMSKILLETRDEAREAKVVAASHYDKLITRIDNLPIAVMQSEIKSNTDSIRVLDKNLSRVDGRVSILERDFENIKKEKNRSEFI